MKKIARATRTNGNVYDVTYDRSVACDKNVPWSYIRRLLRMGYTVDLDQSGYRPEGEPATQTYTPDMV